MKKEKILLVDDEADILEIVGYNLKKEGFEVTTTDNGKDAIKLAKKENPDLIILDVMMPEMDGDGDMLPNAQHTFSKRYPDRFFNRQR